MKRIILIIIVALIVFSNNFLFDKPIQNFIHWLTIRPSAWLVGKFQWTSSLKQRLANNDELLAKNRELEETIAELTGQLAGYDTAKRENEFLRRQLGVNPTRAGQLIAARVLDVRKTRITSTILIGRGSKDNVVPGMTVIAAGNVFVGIVFEVFKESSSVVLADDPRLNINIRLRGTNVLGRTEGTLNGKFKINLVENSEEIPGRSDVISAGLDGMPEALLIGQVESAEESKDKDLFQDIAAKTLFDLSLSSNVFVMTSLTP